MPSSTRLTFIRLLVNSPAQTSSAIEIAICDRRQRRAEPLGGLAAARLTGLALERAEQVGIGAVPGREQAEEQAGADGDARRRTAAPCRPSSPAAFRPLRSAASRRSGRASIATRAGRPGRRSPPAPPIRSAAGRSAGARLAPIDSRIAISLDRAAARASSRLAMFAQAMSRTRPVTASSSSSGTLRFAVDRGLTAGAGLEQHLPRLEPRHRLIAHAALQRRFDVVDDGAIRHVQLRPRLLDGGARPQPREQVGPVAAAVVELVEARDSSAPRSVIGTKTCGLAPSVVPSKPSGATPTMVRCWPLTISVSPTTPGIAVEPRRPVGVTEHDDQRLAELLIVLGREQPADRRRQAEDGEVAAGDQHALAVQGLVVEGEVGAEQHVRGDVGEDRVAPSAGRGTSHS